VSAGRKDLVLVAKRLGRLRERAAFVGGATLELLITDAGAGPVRPTDDVDVVLPVRTRREFLEDVSDALRRAGFKHDLRDDAPICRWIVEGVTVDVMPTDESILGFANRWYEAGLRHAQRVELEPRLEVRIFAGPYFLATKIEAFKDRGRGDFLRSIALRDTFPRTARRKLGSRAFGPSSKNSRAAAPNDGRRGQSMPLRAAAVRGSSSALLWQRGSS
jgi:hypothetical protein